MKRQSTEGRKGREEGAELRKRHEANLAHMGGAGGEHVGPCRAQLCRADGDRGAEAGQSRGGRSGALWTYGGEVEVV